MTNYLEQDDLNNLLNEEQNVEIDKEDDALPKPLERKLYIEKSDRSLFDLNRMIEEGIIILNPSFQRKFVWNNKQCSRFIESLFIGLPIPTIFLSENPDGAIYEVVDGQQRLTAINRFLNDQLRLSGLSTLENFNGETFSTIKEEHQRKFKNSITLSIVIISKDSDPTVKYDIFQRINEGSIKLNNQELRNVMYRGKMVNNIQELSEKEPFINIFSRDSNTVKKQIDQEFILRMVSMDNIIKKSENNYLSLDNTKYHGSFLMLMNNFLDKYRNDEQKIQELNTEFLETMNEIYNFFGDETFCMPVSYSDDNWNLSKLKNRTLAEFLYILFKNANNKLLDKNKIYKIIYDNKELFSRTTGNIEVISKRLHLINNIISE